MKKEAVIQVKISPKASTSEISGWEEGVLKVRIAAVPEKGKANRELVKVLAKELKISQSEIQIISGEKSRNKKVLIKNLPQNSILGDLP